MIVCAGCEKPIVDKYLMNVLDQSWHAGCVNCVECNSALTETCYSRDGKLYCKKDFFRNYGTKCGGCNNGISPNELVRKAKDQVYHLKCFICVACKKQLSTGEELYILPEQRFLCRSDYLSSKYKDGQSSDMEDNEDVFGVNDSAEINSEAGDISDRETSFDGDILPSPHTDDCMKDSASLDIKLNNNNNIIQSDIHTSNNSPQSDKEESNSVGDDVTSNKRRGPRTTIKAKQLEVLKAAFAATPKPTRHIREQLAAETGLNMRVIQVWFQNRRSKERRLKQMNSMGARRPFFGRTARRMRASHLDDSPDMPPPYGYYHPEGHTPDGFYTGLYQGYPQEFYPNQHSSGPPPEAFMATPDLQTMAHQGMHDGFIPDVLSAQSANPDMLAGQLDNGYPRSSVYNNMATHPPQPIESW